MLTAPGPFSRTARREQIPARAPDLIPDPFLRPRRSASRTPAIVICKAEAHWDETGNSKPETRRSKRGSNSETRISEIVSDFELRVLHD
jgi:hypothetical protein